MPSKKPFLSTIIVFVSISFSLISSVWASSTLWTQTYGGADNEQAYCLVETSDGGYAIVGIFETESWWNESWLIKTDAYGNMEWNKTYFEAFRSLVVTSDGGFAMAGYAPFLGVGDYDFRLVKTDQHGNVEWTQYYREGANFEQAYCLVETADEGYAIVGDTSPTISGSLRDVWLVKTDEFGNMEWNRTYGGTGDDNAHCLVEASDGGYAFAGSTTSFGDGERKMWLVKTDANGNMEWNKRYGMDLGSEAYALAETADGGYALVGIFETESLGIESWLIKTYANGTVKLNKSFGGDGRDVLYALVETSDGGLALAGETDSFAGAVDNDGWLLKIDSSGNLEWSYSYGGVNYDSFSSLVMTPNGGFAIAGYTGSFGAGGDDFWLVKTDEFGVIPEFPSWIILPLFLTVTLVVAVYRRKLFKANNPSFILGA